MVTCKRCGRELEAGDLVRHELERLLVVHCPNCGRPVGWYKRHGDEPETDRLRE